MSNCRNISKTRRGILFERFPFATHTLLCRINETVRFKLDDKRVRYVNYWRGEEVTH